MGRREIAATFFALVASGGLSAVIGVSALAADSPLVPFLLYGGIGAIVVGVTGLLVMFIWPGRKLPPPVTKPDAPATIKIGIVERSSFSKMRTHGEGGALEVDRATDLTVDDWKHTQSSRDD